MEDVDATKAKLIDAAGNVFAEKGFRLATIREICAKAGANVASVNYHFGDKLGLYTEVLKDSAGPELQAGIRARIAACSSPEEQLRIFVTGMLDKLMASDRTARNIRIMAQELANPTPALEAVIEHVIRPQYEQLCQIIGRFISSRSSSRATRLCVYSIIGQIVYYLHARAVLTHLWPEFKMTPAQRQEIAEHIVQFTLAGLTAVKSKHERSEK